MSIKQYLEDKYNRWEIFFFLTYYVAFSILSGLEYNLLERGNISLAFKEFPERLLYGLKAIIPGLIFYKFLIQRFLFEKKYSHFAVGVVIYLIFLNLYTIYGYLLVSKLGFLSESLANQAAKWYESKAIIRFSVVYMFREFLVLTALAYFIRSVKQDSDIAKLNKLQLTTELDYLKAQIQPHFFFNTLNNIYSLTLQRSDKAAPLVAKHSDIMRYMLYIGNEQRVSLQKEVDFLRNYIEVEAVRYPERISIDFEVQGVQSSTLIAPLLLLPFIENTFKHGIREELEEGFVLVIISQIGKELSLEVSNSKSTTEPTKETTGIGLKNVRKRLDLIYQNRYDLIIEDQEEVYKVSLTLLLENDD
ncbi:MAG: hypothetical protein EOO90_10165 [Pedobacter sp.]|nr:MAG: hypothetical protein EOO90_10165 [Pedobacter sp.]